MSVFSRFGVAALVLTGSVATAAFAANHPGFHDRVTMSVAGFTDNVLKAGAMMSGDRHLAYEEEGISDKVFTDRIDSASVVTHVEVIGGGTKQRIVLLDPNGREVYSHDPVQNTTIIAKDTIVPSVTVREGLNATAELRVVTAAPSIEAPEELRQALVAGDVDPQLFYREDL